MPQKLFARNRLLFPVAFFSDVEQGGLVSLVLPRKLFGVPSRYSVVFFFQVLIKEPWLVAFGVATKTFCAFAPL